MKYIAIASILMVSSPMVTGATYDLLEEREDNLADQELKTFMDNKFDGASFLSDSVEQSGLTNRNQDYLEIFNLIKKNDFNNAEIKIEDLKKQFPNAPEVYNLQALLETLRKNKESAIKSYQKAVALDQQNLTAHLGLAMLFLEAGNLTLAKEHANKSLAIDDKSTYAYLMLAGIAAKENRQEQIENLLSTALEKNQGNIKQELTVASNLAKFYVSKKQPEKNLTLAQDIINRYPNESMALSFLTYVQLLNNRKDEAVQTLEKLVSQRADDVGHRFLLARILMDKPENEKQVLKLLDEISSIAPDNLQVQAQKTVFLIKLKQFSEALSTANKLRELSPNTGLSELLEGDIYLAENELENALSSYRKAYDIRPNNKVLNQIATIMIKQKRQSKAIEFLNEELKKNKKNLAAHFELARIYENQKNVSKAEEHYQAILAEQPNNTLVLNNLAWFYYQQNNPKALSLAEKAYQNAPASPVIADTYGTILTKHGELAKGLKVLETASKSAPADYDIQYRLANAYALNGKNEQAIKILNGIVKSKRNFSEKNSAMNLLKKLNGN